MFLGIFVGAPAILFGVIFVIGRLAKSRSLTLFGAIPLVCLSALVLLFSLLFLVDLWLFSDPKSVYQMEFGASPTSDIGDLQASYSSISDSADVKMKFKASPASIKQIVKLKGLHWAPRPESFPSTTDSEGLDWWRPKVGPQSQFYQREGKGEHFSSERTYLIFDPKTQTAYYSFFGVD